MSILSEAADAIKGWLETKYEQQSELTVSITRTYFPEWELKDLGMLHLTVVPMEHEVSRASRNSSEWNIRVDVGISQKVSSDSELDACLDIVQELMEGLTGEIFNTEHYQVIIMSVKDSPAISDKHYLENGQYLSVIQVLGRVFN